LIGLKALSKKTFKNMVYSSVRGWSTLAFFRLLNSKPKFDKIKKKKKKKKRVKKKENKLISAGVTDRSLPCPTSRQLS